MNVRDSKIGYKVLKIYIGNLKCKSILFRALIPSDPLRKILTRKLSKQI